MAELPTGTVTFLFTDIEGSTVLLRELGLERYREILSTHDRLLRTAFDDEDGVEISRQGDSFVVAFASARGAVRAAVAAQRALQAEPWAEAARVRVRMGLHSGELTAGKDGYVGFPLHRGARIGAAAHGCQVLLSSTSHGLIEQDLPAGVSVRDLGEVSLADLGVPERLFQLLIDGLADGFPPLRTGSGQASQKRGTGSLRSAPAGKATGSSRPVKVLIADDQALVRAGFRMILDSEPGIEVVGEATNGLEAIELARQSRPDVVLMDVRMPELDGLEATRRLVAHDDGSLHVLVLTTFDHDEYVYEALRAGASGFLLKDTPPEQLVAAISVIAAGDALLSPSITRRMIEEFARKPGRPERPRELDDLTRHELEVLRLMARGFSNAEIEEQLLLSEEAVKADVATVLTKLGLRDRVQAVVLAYEIGLVQPGLS